jgi:hypothetical protein
MKPISSLLLLSIGLLMASCSPRLSPFTQDLYESNAWTEGELKRIQFYLSDDVVLQRKAKGGRSTIANGEIKIINGEKIEQIVLREGTPGVLLFIPKEDRFAIGFENGKDKRYLMFGPNPKAGGRYTLLASDWVNRKGKITYEGNHFWIDSRGGIANLMVDLKRTRNVSVSSRTASGRRVN